MYAIINASHCYSLRELNAIKELDDGNENEDGGATSGGNQNYNSNNNNNNVRYNRIFKKTSQVRKRNLTINAYIYIYSIHLEVKK